jgi:hypothetical protein
MREIARDPHFDSRFDALVVDEAQDHDTSWPGSESDKTDAGWWEIYWKLLKEKTNVALQEKLRLLKEVRKKTATLDVSAKFV